MTSLVNMFDLIVIYSFTRLFQTINDSLLYLRLKPYATPLPAPDPGLPHRRFRFFLTFSVQIYVPPSLVANLLVTRTQPATNGHEDRCISYSVLSVE